MGAIVSTYISNEGENKILFYAKTGKDRSILHKRILSPVADLLLNQAIPTWLSPTMIQFLAFLCVLIPFIVLTAELRGNLQGHVHHWLSIFTSFGLLLYLVLKAVAKKQAKRGGYINAMDAFIDHQVSGVNIMITATSFCMITQIGNDSFSVVAFSMGMIPFFTATWERYVIGTYNRWKINAENEGLLAIAIVMFITGVAGSEIWPDPKGSSWRVQEVLILVVAIWPAIAVLLNFIKIYKKDPAPKKFLRNLVDISMYAYTLAVMYYVTYRSVNKMVTRKAIDIIVYFGLFNAKYSGILFLCHMSGDKFRWFRYSKFIGATFLLIDCVQAYYKSTSMIEEDFVIQGLMIYEFFSWLYFIFGATQQLIYTMDYNLIAPLKPKPDHLDKYELKQLSENYDFYGHNETSIHEHHDNLELHPRRRNSLPETIASLKNLTLHDGSHTP